MVKNKSAWLTVNHPKLNLNFDIDSVWSRTTGDRRIEENFVGYVSTSWLSEIMFKNFIKTFLRLQDKSTMNIRNMNNLILSVKIKYEKWLS